MQTQLRKIGNSMGIIIGKKMLDQSGINPSVDVNIEVSGGAIIITSLNRRRPANRHLETWGTQIRSAIKRGQKPDKSVWKNNVSKAFEKEWSW
jgi:antitoxin component of MazEF toxin-antitoxin module